MQNPPPPKSRVPTLWPPKPGVPIPAPRHPPGRHSIPAGPDSAGVGGTSQRKAAKEGQGNFTERQKFTSSTQVAAGAPGGGCQPSSQLGWRGDRPLGRRLPGAGAQCSRAGGPGKRGDGKAGGGQAAPIAGARGAPQAPARRAARATSSSSSGDPGLSSPASAAAAVASRSFSKSH